MASTAKWSFLCVMVAVLGPSPTAQGQVSTLCNAWRSIDPQPGNPFAARSVRQDVRWEPDGTERTALETSGSVARDSKGRVYNEWHVGDPSVREKTTRPAVGKPSANRIYSMAGILDCGGGKAISIYPDLEIARTTEGPPREPDHTSFFETLAYNQRPSNAVFEDLGYKEIEGFPTHGFRVTVLGTQRDGDWNGKATQVTEAWVSDDLAMTMLEIHTNLRTKYETRDRRSHVSRQEPDPFLFEIPAGYEVNPPSKENSPSKENPKPSVHQ
jgi:hypothetical protein